MMDKLTVMGCLEGLTQDDWQQWYSDSEVQETAKAALSLLKEQEPIEPIISDGDDLYWQPGDEDYACGACGEELAGSWWIYCPYCGRKVAWNEVD